MLLEQNWERAAWKTFWTSYSTAFPFSVVVYRIADARHPIFDPPGAMLHSGRWNSPGIKVIYAAATYAGALLEVLFHGNLAQAPKNHRAVRIEIPDDLKLEVVTPSALPHWDAEDAATSRAFGDAWHRSQRSAVLQVPSVITLGHEQNLVLNPNHSEFSRIRVGPPEAVHWDARLFRR